jgi:hypothetical protein
MSTETLECITHEVEQLTPEEAVTESEAKWASERDAA